MKRWEDVKLSNSQGRDDIVENLGMKIGNLGWFSNDYYIPMLYFKLWRDTIRINNQQLW